jgi:hypothetical protein
MNYIDEGQPLDSPDARKCMVYFLNQCYAQPSSTALMMGLEEKTMKRRALEMIQRWATVGRASWDELSELACIVEAIKEAPG